MALLALVQFMFALDTTIVNVALPTIKRELHFGTSGLAWVVNGYTLVAGGFLIVGGRLADLFGRRRMFIVGTIVFALASAASGLAQSSGMLITSRFVQGLGEALAAPAALSLVVLLFEDPKERAQAIGGWAGITILGATLGVVISGVIVDEISWRWIFLVNLPVAAFVILFVSRMIHESRASGKPRIDVLGAVLVTGGLTLLVDGVLNASSHHWGSSAVIAPLAAGIALLVAFAASQVAVRQPLVPLRFFANRTRVSANLATIFGSGAFLGMFFTITLYMQNDLHYSPLKAGLAWGPFGLALLVGIATSAQLLSRIGVKNGLAFSFTVSAIGLFLLSRIGPDADYLGVLLPGMLIMAFGQGIIFPGLQTSALQGLGRGDAGLGAAVQNTSLQVGGSLGLAVLVTVALRHTASSLAHGLTPLLASSDGYSLAIKISAGIMLLGAIIVITTFERVDFVPPDQIAIDVAEASLGSDGFGTNPRPVPTSAATARHDSQRRRDPSSSHRCSPAGMTGSSGADPGPAGPRRCEAK
ncbi:MAG TPA: MFS transporter [Solirubrobacteraceae bacterium]|jgi:EmrB/QacA subfamily drug resistance transporter